MDVRGKTVVVAGGAGSLGTSIVQTLAGRGARVAILDVRAPERFTADVCGFVADVADERSALQAFSDVQAALGTPSALVNCAGLIHSEPLLNVLDRTRQRHRLESWEAVLRSNLTATFILGAIAAEAMVHSRTKGVIVNFSSIASDGNPGQSAYAAAKAGVEALTAVWARELGPFGIRALAIAPGFVDTPSTRAAVPERMLADIARRTPLRRLATPQEIADAVAFAIESDFLTGRTLSIDGGLTL